MPTRPRMTKTQRLAHERLKYLVYFGREDNPLNPDALREEIPDAWRSLEFDLDVEAPKEKVTLYLDQSVARMFRRMGKGYQARINRILQTWLQLKMSESIGLEQEMADSLRRASEAADKNAADDYEKRMEAIAKDWAYAKGVEDGLAAAREGEASGG